MSYGNRWDQTKAAERHGTDAYGQASDGTGTTNHFGKFNTNGSLTDSTITEAAITTIITQVIAIVSGVSSSIGPGEIPAGVRDGANTVFTLAHTPTNGASLQLFVNGILQRPTFDFALVGNTIYFAFAPKADDWIFAFYGFTT